MCGICGIVSHDGVKEEMLLSMNEALSHRGPDDRGLYLGQGVGLGHRRLSIIDVAGGRQPMSNEDETVWVVFNGEIYNYRELREDLLQRGHRFETDSDTEVILHLYEEHGERCVEKLSGMFAFGLWDTGARKLFLARDRIGQKPLFYTAGKSGFLFASEVKGLLAHGSVERRMDERSLSHYLSLRFIPAPHTMFRNIRKLPPAHCLVFENGKERIFRYWDLTFRRKVNLPGRAMIDLLEEKLREAVRSHLASDVPVGAFLSGGMDSSMIVALMGGLCADPFKTFAVGVGDGDYNELPHARVVSELYQTEHMEKTVDADLIGSLPEMIRCLDEPSDPIAACMFQAAELAGRHVKVVMGGDGGDELFGGFDRYMGMGLVDHYNKIPEVVRKRIAAPLIGRLRDSFAYKSAAQKLRWVDTLSAYAGGERYAAATSIFRFSHGQKAELFRAGVWKRIKGVDSSRIITDLYNGPNAEEPLDRMLYADFMTRLPEHTLMLTDRMNMAHGVEARSPYLDHSLVELTARFPGRTKVSGVGLKKLLRKLGQSYLPPKITGRRKQGFMFPVAHWFKERLHGFLMTIFMNSGFIRETFREETLLRIMDEHRKGWADHHVRLWMLLNLDLWHRLYMEGRPVDALTAELSEIIRSPEPYPSFLKRGG